MSRFDVDDNGEQSITWEMWDWNLRRTLAGKKGQAALSEFRNALLAVPGHRLAEGQIATLEGDVCAIGAFTAYKRVQRGQSWAAATADLNQTYHAVETWTDRTGYETTYENEVDPWETQALGMRECGLNATLAWHLGYQNDETYGGLTPGQRWWRFYTWVCEQLGDKPDKQYEP